MASRLHAAVEESRWADVRRVLKVAPQEARAVDECGRTPLHAAARSNALLSIMRLLFEAEPLLLCALLASPILLLLAHSRWRGGHAVGELRV